MSRRWLIAIAAAVLLIESAATLPARADGGEELLQRLLDDGRVQTTSVGQKNTGVAVSGAARTTPRDAIRLTPDRTEIIRLDQDAASVVVTNPAHAQVMMETSRLLLVMPRTPGSTSLFVLDKDGQTILERDIIVSATANSYVRIRKSCTAGDAACATNAYYYCPDGCYEVSTVPPTTAGTVPEIAGGTATIDNTPLPPEAIPPNAQSRTEPAPLPLMDDEAGLDTDAPLDMSTDTEETSP